MSESAHFKALLLVEAVRDALARGTRHYDVRGRELTTEREVLEALVRDGRIELEPKRNAS